MEVLKWRVDQAGEVFLWMNTVISPANTWMDGTYHGRVRARLKRYLEECTYRFNRGYMRPRIADRLLMACVTSPQHPDARQGGHRHRIFRVK